MNKCPRCGKNNPAEVHTCTPGYHFTEHEKFKAICDKIEYKINRELIETDGATYSFEVDVREIIFTPEFMDKLIDFIKKNNLYITKGDYMNGWLNHLKVKIIDNLNNPVNYLFNLIINE